MTHRGFIALTSVLILSAVLLMLVVGTSIPAFYARMGALNAEWKAQSSELAQGCVGAVQLRLITTSGYTGGETISIDAASCVVSLIEESGSIQKFTASITYRQAATTLSVSLSKDDASIVSEKEIPSTGL